MLYSFKILFKDFGWVFWGNNFMMPMLLCWLKFNPLFCLQCWWYGIIEFGSSHCEHNLCISKKFNGGITDLVFTWATSDNWSCWLVICISCAGSILTLIIPPSIKGHGLCLFIQDYVFSFNMNFLKNTHAIAWIKCMFPWLCIGFRFYVLYTFSLNFQMTLQTMGEVSYW